MLIGAFVYHWLGVTRASNPLFHAVIRLGFRAD